jgi:hypothetical protein
MSDPEFESSHLPSEKSPADDFNLNYLFADFTSEELAEMTSRVESFTMPEIEPNDITRESIEAQSGMSLKSYEMMVGILNKHMQSSERIIPAGPVEFVDEFDHWLTKPKIEYVREQCELDPELRFNLVTTPNVVIPTNIQFKFAEDFAKYQFRHPFSPLPATIYGAPYYNYTAEQLSGTNTANGRRFQFSLIPNKYTKGMDGKVSEQIEKLTELQIKFPFLRVPSVLEALGLWNLLRIRGDGIVGEIANETTTIRHIDLPKYKMYADKSCIISTSAYILDSAWLGSSLADEIGTARIEIG